MAITIIKKATVVLIVLMSVFTIGCNSKEEKVNKVEKFNKLEEQIQIVDKTSTFEAQALAEKRRYKEMIEIAEKSLNEQEKLVSEMERVAKGNKELEARASKRRVWLETSKNLFEKGKAGFKKDGVIK